MTINTPQTANNNADAAANSAPGESETITKLRAEVAELRLGSARADLLRKLEAAGARSPELLLTSVADKLQLASDGDPEIAAVLVDQLKRDLPEQFGPGHAASVSIDAGSGAAGNARPLTRATLARMSPEQISRLDWAAVRQVLSQA